MDMAEPEAAVAIVQARPRQSILLIRRSERKRDSWSGQWSFPGGRRDAEDTDLLHTALRELEEEVGIRLGREHCKEVVPHVLARRKTGRFVLVAPFVFEVDGELPTVVDQREAVEAVWVPQSVWGDPERHSLRAVPWRPDDSLYPAIDLNGTPLWGFTYRVLTDWLGLLPTHTPIELAGFEMACRVLDFLLSHGLKAKSEWEDRTGEAGTLEGRPEALEGRAAKVVTVEGAIPAALVIEHFARPGTLFPCINLLEVRTDYIRIAGLAFEEYLILAA
jgi:8-oxo-dGTP pyrophosphatase MutT (NUDIX family)